MSEIELALSVALGIALAAASGFRIFLPLLVASITAYGGHLPLSDGFAWLGTLPAVLMLSVAAIVEVLAFYIPGVDNLLDAVAAPGAVVAGIVISAAAMTDVSPMLKWALAIVAGGGAAGLTQAATTFIRAHSTVLTAGLGNPVVATAELAGATVISILAVAAPVIALGAVLAVLLLAYRLMRRIRREKGTPAS
jgi:Domain of unknown function (DUF4126)